MKRFETIGDIAQVLGDGGSFNSDVDFKTYGEVVDALIDLGNTEKVYARHDDHLGLKDRLSDTFLDSPINDTNSQQHESEIEDVLEQARIIIPLSERELSDDDIEEIEEDRAYRGEDSDD